MDNLNFEIKNISSLPKKVIGEGTTRIKFKDLVDKEIIIRDALIFVNKFKKETAVIEFEIPGDKTLYSSITSNVVVVKKINECLYHSFFPVKGKVVYNGRYYDIV